MKRQALLLKDAFPEDRRSWEVNIEQLGGVGPNVTSRLEVYLESHLEEYPAWEFLAFCYQVQGHFVYAERIYKYLLEHRPGVARYHYYLGNVMWFTRKREAALDCWGEAVKLDPGGRAGNKAMKKMARMKKLAR